MNADFTVKTYRELLGALMRQGFCFQTVERFMANPLGKVVVMRHDVDRLPRNALVMARLEHELHIPATYYFRAVSESWNEGVIREIAGLGHEVGYHYECLGTASIAQRRRGAEKRRDDSDGWRAKLYALAYEDFCRNLERLRAIVRVSTVCMHGSPLSGIDNLDLLRKYDYKSLGLVAEPYLDFDFNQMCYLTDTGRRWDGEKVSVRDKVRAQSNHLAQRRKGEEKRRDDLDDAFGGMNSMNGWLDGKNEWPRFHSTSEIIAAIEAGRFPDKVMMTVHPQRWTDDPIA